MPQWPLRCLWVVREGPTLLQEMPWISTSPSLQALEIAKKLALQNVTLANMSVRKLTCQRAPPLFCKCLLSNSWKIKRTATIVSQSSINIKAQLEGARCTLTGCLQETTCFGDSGGPWIQKKKGESFLWGCLVPKSPGSKPPIYPVNEETQGKKNVRVVGWGTWWCPSGCTRNKFGSCNFTDKAKDSGNACIAQVSQYFVIHPTTST